MVVVHLGPSQLGSFEGAGLVVDEVAPLPETAKSFSLEPMTHFCFVRSIMFHVYSQLMRPMGELALASVGTLTFGSVVFAEGGLGFARELGGGGFGERVDEMLVSELILVSLCGGLAFEVEWFVGEGK